MCFSCGGWPWSHTMHLAPPPVKDEYIYLDSNYAFYPDHRSGLHPPAPVYQSNQPAQTAMYYYQGNSTMPAGYYYNGYYYGPTAPTTGWTTSSSYAYYPTSTSPATYYYPYKHSPYYTAQAAGPAYYPVPISSLPAMTPWAHTSTTAQAAAALAANATLSAMPNAPAYFVGGTAADIQAQHSIFAAYLAAQGLTPQPQQMPSQLVPYKPGASQQFWCKELDGSWTLREHNDVVMGELGPGRWERHPRSGYFYYVKSTD